MQARACNSHLNRENRKFPGFRPPRKADDIYDVAPFKLLKIFKEGENFPR